MVHGAQEAKSTVRNGFDNRCSRHTSDQVAAQSLDISEEHLLIDWRWFGDGEGKRPAGPRVDGIAGDEVRMQMRDRISQQVVVHLHRPEVRFERPGDAKDFEPVPSSLVGREFGWLCHMATAPFHDRVDLLFTKTAAAGPPEQKPSRA